MDPKIFVIVLKSLISFLNNGESGFLSKEFFVNLMCYYIAISILILVLKIFKISSESLIITILIVIIKLSSIFLSIVVGVSMYILILKLNNDVLNTCIIKDFGGYFILIYKPSFENFLDFIKLSGVENKNAIIEYILKNNFEQKYYKILKPFSEILKDLSSEVSN